MEDFLALLVVLAMVGVFWYTLSKILHWRKAKQVEKKIKEEAERVRYSPKQWAPLTPQQYADAIPKRKPAMKKANVSPSYANTPMTSTTSTASVAVPSSDDGFLSGMLVGAALDNMFSHKSEPSVSKSSDTGFSWGLDDSDSRSSISSSMDTSSSSDSWSSSDSGPSSDW